MLLVVTILTLLFPVWSSLVSTGINDCSWFPTKIGPGDIQLRIYNGSNVNSYVEYFPNQTKQMMADPNFNVKRNSVVYIHGWKDNPSYKLNKQRIIPELLDTLVVNNVIIVNWTRMASDNYVKSFLNMYVVAKQVNDTLNGMVSNGYPLSKIHIIGHSIGAQIAGQVGQCINGIIPWITGLDPANPLYFTQLNGTTLSKYDATFVDVMHTDGGVAGSYPAAGDIDYYPNCGIPTQPGCLDSISEIVDTNTCSHQSSIWFYAASITNPDLFLCWIAESWTDFMFKAKENTYNANNAIRWGWKVNKSSKGKCYMYTNSNPPYGRGLNGNTPGT